MRLLIRGSLTTQERFVSRQAGRVAADRRWSSAARARWGAGSPNFSLRRATTSPVADPAGRLEGFAWFADWRDTALDHDLIVVATPLKIANAVLQELARSQTAR